MKNLILILSLMLGFSFAGQAQSKNKVVTDTFTVKGNCGDCQKRIQDAAYLTGVKRAEWNKETKILTVSYKPSKTSKDEISKSIADVGHDSEGHIANDETYKKLPGCCAYRDGAACSH